MQKKCKAYNDVGPAEIAMAVFITAIGLLYYHTSPNPYRMNTSSTMTSTNK